MPLPLFLLEPNDDDDDDGDGVGGGGHQINNSPVIFHKICLREAEMIKINGIHSSSMDVRTIRPPLQRNSNRPP